MSLGSGSGGARAARSPAPGVKTVERGEGSVAIGRRDGDVEVEEEEEGNEQLTVAAGGRAGGGGGWLRLTPAWLLWLLLLPPLPNARPLPNTRPRASLRRSSGPPVSESAPCMLSGAAQARRGMPLAVAAAAAAVRAAGGGGAVRASPLCLVEMLKDESPQPRT